MARLLYFRRCFLYNVGNSIQDVIMFSLFKSDPLKKLNKSYSAILEKAMQAQRSGDIRTYSKLTAEAETIKAEIDALTAGKSGS